MSVKGQSKQDLEYLKSFWSYLRLYKVQLFFGLMMVPLISLFQLVQPMLIKYGVDVNIKAGDIKALYFTASVFAICVGFELIARSLQSYIFQSIGLKSVTNLRQELFAHLGKQSMSFFDKTPVGRLATRVTSDVEALNETLGTGLVTLVADLFTLCGIVAVMLFLSVKLTFITLLVVPPLFLIVNFFKKRLRYFYNHVRSSLSALNSYLNEQLEGCEIIQLFQREKNNYSEFKARNEEYKKANLGSIRYDALLYSVIDAISSIVIGLMVWYGFNEYIEDSITLGLLIAFIDYVRKFFTPLRELSSKFAILQAALAALEKIFGAFNLSNTLVEGVETPVLKTGKVSFDKVSFAYPGHEDKVILKDISFEINPGEFLAVVGPTGSGKSTLISLLSRLYLVQTGSIKIDDVDVSKLSNQAMMDRIAVVRQDVVLFSDTIEFNISLGDERIHLDACVRACKLLGADDFISKLPGGYQHVLKARGAGLSAGEAQLISFARTLVRDVPIIVLDEATASIDSLSEGMIQRAIKKVLEHKTVLVIAHRLSTIKKANRILAMCEGQIVEEGTHEKLLETDGFYAKLYKMQFAHLGEPGHVNA